MKNKPISSKVIYIGKTVKNILKKLGGRLVEDKEYRTMQRLQEFAQTEPPRKGVFATVSVERCAELSKYWKELVMARLNDKLKVNIDQKESWLMIIEGEKFQLNAKGPVVVTAQNLKEALDKIMERSRSELFDDETKKKADRFVLNYLMRLEQYKIRGKGMKSFNFIESGRSMDGQRLRGLPLDLKGADRIKVQGKEVTVDEFIIGKLGNDMRLIIQELRNIGQAGGGIFVSLTRNRLQAPNKYRFINVVFILYQYLLLPIVDDSMAILKQNVPQFASLLEPLAKEKALGYVLRPIKGYVDIPADYSGFDQLTDLRTRLNLLEGLLRIIYADASGIPELMSLLREIEPTLMLLVPSFNKVSPLMLVGAQNLLASGKVDTTLTGSNYGGFLTEVPADYFKFEIVKDSIIIQSDDLSMKIPLVVIERAGGYQKFMEQGSEALKPFGAVINPKKQIPETMLGTTIFLQRVYNRNLGIFGLYSLTRTIDSLIYAERFRSQVAGIRNIPALQQIGQLSLFNNCLVHPLTTIHYDDVVEELIAQWLQVDTKLYSVIKSATKEYSDDQKAGLLAFNYICYSAGGVQSVLQSESFGNGSQEGSHTINREKVEAITKSLPILAAISRVARKSKQKSELDYHEFYKVKTKIDKSFIEGNDIIWSGGM